MSVGGLLNKTCSINRGAQSQSPTGAIITAYTVLATLVPCAVQVRDARKNDVPRSGHTEFDVFFLNGRDVQVADVLSAVPGYPSAVFTVDSAGVDDAGRSAYTRVRAVYETGRNDIP